MEPADLDERSDCMKEDGKISKQIERITRYEILMNKAEQMIMEYSQGDKVELCKIMDEDGIYNLIEKYNELRDEYSYRINT